KPSMDLLPAKSLASLRQYIEESREEQGSLLVGVEVAQRLYRDCVSKCTDSPGASPTLDEFRKVLIATDNKVIEGLVKTFDPLETAQILKYMSYERSTVFMRSLPIEVLKSATAALDQTPDNRD